MNLRNLIFGLVAVVGVALDQATKAWIVANVPVGAGEIHVIPGFLSIVHARNPGAAFGVLRGFSWRHELFLLFTLVAVGVILDLLRKLPPSSKLMSVSLGLILSGAVGNVIDRIRFRYVVDFIRVYTEQPTLEKWLIGTFGTNEWPSFNVADSALVVGVGIFVVHHFLYERSHPAIEQPTPAGAPTPTTAPPIVRRDASPEDAPTDPSEQRTGQT